MNLESRIDAALIEAKIIKIEARGLLRRLEVFAKEARHHEFIYQPHKETIEDGNDAEKESSGSQYRTTNTSRPGEAKASSTGRT